MVKYSFLIVLVLAACGAQPAPEFFGAERYETSRDGRDYTIFKKANRFEVIRLGYVARGDHDRIRETMLEVVESITKCRIKPNTIQGDSGEMRGSLNCS
ncbi:hypothetical protein SAMN05421774_101263 [Gemmobacter megaterium]|uniref:Uncharacterized protein n=1 Tax=Gemmobacter megaterium TaxID=1086013 RepID=A0A1N7K7X0_9RHOB|nr:hypothetical protein [Gemmobacter megaterium]GGE00762.1 hypothetical protein GCM10011345_02580 [Gemmobacter megaterium]SIS57658.1 hypothetical protein SAMN05421774_101263 [Gemmobacter megaterium]